MAWRLIEPGQSTSHRQAVQQVDGREDQGQGGNDGIETEIEAPARQGRTDDDGNDRADVHIPPLKQRPDGLRGWDHMTMPIPAAPGMVSRHHQPAGPAFGGGMPSLLAGILSRTCGDRHIGCPWRGARTRSRLLGGCSASSNRLKSSGTDTQMSSHLGAGSACRNSGASSSMQKHPCAWIAPWE